MGSVVNNILNKVDMNTTKYNQKLQNMRRDTKKATDSISKSFSSIASSWKSIVGALATGAFVKAISDTQIELEKSVTAMSGIAGGLDNSRRLFEQLQVLARECNEPFDSLQKTAISIGKVGIEPTKEAMKGLKQISLATGQSMETTANAFSQIMMGKYKSLNQLGIKAEDVGDKLKLTYNGVTKEIDKNNQALSDYIVELGSANSEAFDNMKNNLDYKINDMQNAWGDFVRLISESGIADIIKEIVDDIKNGIDGLTNYLKTNDGFLTFVQSIKDTFHDVKEGFKSLFSSIADMTDSSSVNWSDYVGNFLNLFKIGLVTAVTYFTEFFKAIWDMAVKYYDNVSEIFTKIVNFDFSNISFGDLYKGMGKAFKSHMDLASKTVDLYTKDLLDRTKKGVEETKKKLEELNDSYETNNKKLTFGKGDDEETKKNKDKIDRQFAQWQSYYDKLKTMHNEQTMSRSQLEDLRYQTELQKLQEFHAQGLASEQEYLLALETLQTEHQNNINNIKEEAYRQYQTAIEKNTKGKKLNALGIEEKDFNNTIDGLNDMSTAFGNLTNVMSENSSEYKVVFAMQKAFSVASTTMNCINAWAKALGTSTTWYEAIANYASAMAMTTQIIAQIKSVNMYDKGGNIPSGAIGIVGEYGPEIIRGPANVTSRKDTAELLENAGSNVVVNLYEDSSKAGTVEQNQTDEGSIINIFVSNIRKGGQMASVLQQSYGLKRVGY